MRAALNNLNADLVQQKEQRIGEIMQSIQKMLRE